VGASGSSRDCHKLHTSLGSCDSGEHEAMFTTTEGAQTRMCQTQVAIRYSHLISTPLLGRPRTWITPSEACSLNVLGLS